MPKAAKTDSPKSVNSCNMSMRAPVIIDIGTTLLFPYSSEVACGEPTYWKWVHGKYHGKTCIVIGITTDTPRRGESLSNDSITLEVEFSDGYKAKAGPDAFVFADQLRRK